MLPTTPTLRPSAASTTSAHPRSSTLPKPTRWQSTRSPAEEAAATTTMPSYQPHCRRVGHNALLLLVALLAVLASPAQAYSASECCENAGVTSECVQILCRTDRTSDDFEMFDAFDSEVLNCSRFLDVVGTCLANGRDRSACCKETAKHKQINGCFSLCSGNPDYSDPRAFTNCYYANHETMKACFQTGYNESPTPPRSLRFVNIGSSSLDVSWDPPAVLAESVKSYRITLQELVHEEDAGLEFVEAPKPTHYLHSATEDTSMTIDNLVPGASYQISMVAVASDSGIMSASSDLLTFQTHGLAPEIEAYADTVYAGEGASTVLACRVRMTRVHDSTRFIWSHKLDDGSNEELLDGPHYNTSHYVFFRGRTREYLSLVEIRNVKADSFGTYSCSVVDKYGVDSDEVHLALQRDVTEMQVAPPRTALECCQSRGVENKCLAMCGMYHAGNDKRVPRPFMPSNCSGMIAKVLSCAMTGVNDGACCLRQHVPRPCMYLCDNSISPSNHIDPMCLEQIGKVETCRIEGVTNRPRALTVKVEQTDDDKTTVSWKRVPNALIYHLYWRNYGDVKWQRKATTELTEVVDYADEMVLVAANRHGLSQPSRFQRHKRTGVWSRVV